MSLRHFWRNVVRNPERDRWQWWPIRIMWRRGAATYPVDWHGWQVDSEPCPAAETSKRCVTGWRAVFGQTIHFGPLKVALGRNRSAASEVAP